MPARSDYGSVSMSMSPPPPTNLSSYSRFMHDHTKRQMEASGASPPPTNATAQRAQLHSQHEFYFSIFVVLPWLLGRDISRDANGGEAAPSPF
ncbi:hypothetical protein FACUT_111 [Fusarium acutatum]|uniref:Uncharacterized protein n=1 Tax=Fusarium acutatum TaxID=78861 RepID=A0A8H4P1I3_9HYPO|nr:hypothetical protein FACUT_111 [Fusarium acutatum]